MPRDRNTPVLRRGHSLAHGSIVLIHKTLVTTATTSPRSNWRCATERDRRLSDPRLRLSCSPSTGKRNARSDDWLYDSPRDVCCDRVLAALTEPNQAVRNAAFWGLLALSLLGGNAIGDFGRLAGLARGFAVRLLGRSIPNTSREDARPVKRAQHTFLRADHPDKGCRHHALQLPTLGGTADRTKRETYVFLYWRMLRWRRFRLAADARAGAAEGGMR